MMLELAPANALFYSGIALSLLSCIFSTLREDALDLRVIDANLFAFDWYRERLRTQYPDLFVPEGDDLIALNKIMDRKGHFVRPVSSRDWTSQPSLR